MPAVEPDREHEQRGGRRERRQQLAVRGEALDARPDREQRDQQPCDEPGAAIGDAGDEQRDYACEARPQTVASARTAQACVPKTSNAPR